MTYHFFIGSFKLEESANVKDHGKKDKPRHREFSSLAKTDVMRVANGNVPLDCHG